MFRVLSCAFVSVLFCAVIFCGVLGVYNKKNRALAVWASPYECGFCSNSLRLDSFRFTYFSLLVFFVVFDLEISLLLKLPYQSVLYGNFPFYFSFLVILSFGFVLEVFSGYVRWGY